MVCQSCGAPLVQGVHFCAKCGMQVSAAPSYSSYPAPVAPYLARPRVQRHLQGLGMMWCVFGVYRIAIGLIGYFFLRAATSGVFNWGPFGSYEHYGPFGSHWLAGLYSLILTASIVMAALALLVGYGILTRQPWGRMLAIIVAIISLIKFPFGTVLGIYTLWVLAPAESGAEYDALANQG